MAKTLLREKARKLRSKGKSVKEIAKKLGVAKSTISLWVRDVILTVEQLESLRQNSIKGGERGRLLGALVQKQRRLQLIEDSKDKGEKIIHELTERDFLIAGICLYWAEGTKKAKNVRFCNADPVLINFMIRWLKVCFGILSDDLALTVSLNEIHEPREVKVKNYWSKETGIPLKQFRKTSFKKVVNKKVYDNYDSHYGTLAVDVLKPARFYYKIMGLIHGLGKAKLNIDTPG